MMINANEIRLGNWVRWGGVNVEITTVTIYQRTFYKCTEGLVSGIPLTPEILIACGFVYVEDYAEYRYRESTNWFGVFNEHNDDWYFDKPEMSTVVIKYLHQLQNLYYSLTGQELTYKP